MLGRADRFIVTAGDGEMLAEAALTGRPVALFDLPRWYDDLPVVKPLVARRAVPARRRDLSRHAAAAARARPRSSTG